MNAKAVMRSIELLGKEVIPALHEIRCPSTTTRSACSRKHRGIRHLAAHIGRPARAGGV